MRLQLCQKIDPVIDHFKIYSGSGFPQPVWWNQTLLIICSEFIGRSIQFRHIWRYSEEENAMKEKTCFNILVGCYCSSEQVRTRSNSLFPNYKVRSNLKLWKYWTFARGKKINDLKPWWSHRESRQFDSYEFISLVNEWPSQVTGDLNIPNTVPWKLQRPSSFPSLPNSPFGLPPLCWPLWFEKGLESLKINMDGYSFASGFHSCKNEARLTLWLF